MTVPATAEYIGGFAVTPDGALYVTIDPSSSPTFAGLTLTGQLIVGDGTVSAPAIRGTSSSNAGIFFATDLVRFSVAGTLQGQTNSAGFTFRSRVGLGPTGDGPDAYWTRTSAGSMTLSDETNGKALGIKMLTELTTIAAAATTDTTIQMPAGAIVVGVSVRVTTLIPTAATFTVGDSGSAARFNTGASVAVAAGTTNAGTKAGAYYNASALSVRLTPDLTPADNTGRVRVTIYYIDVTPPTS